MIVREWGRRGEREGWMLGGERGARRDETRLVAFKGVSDIHRDNGMTEE